MYNIETRQSVKILYKLYQYFFFLNYKTKCQINAGVIRNTEAFFCGNSWKYRCYYSKYILSMTQGMLFWNVYHDVMHIILALIFRIKPFSINIDKIPGCIKAFEFDKLV